MSLRKDVRGGQHRSKRQIPIPQILIVVGLLMCLAPVASNLYHIKVEGDNVSSMSSAASSINPATKEYLLEQAQAYNAQLGGYDYGYKGEILPYDQQLVSNETTAIGWLEVPKAAINTTIYHGVSDTALSSGIGHQPETSLPVGGQKSHCYLAGHSGVQQYRVFDGIRALETGDVFAVHVLGDVYAYRVTGWQIVDPETIDITPQQGDRCTLVTCTTTPDTWNPKGRIGINDKRLLVTGERCEYDPSEFENTAADVSVYINDNTRPMLLAAILLVGGTLTFLIGRRVHKSIQKRKGN